MYKKNQEHKKAFLSQEYIKATLISYTTNTEHPLPGIDDVKLTKINSKK